MLKNRANSFLRLPVAAFASLFLFGCSGAEAEGTEPVGPKLTPKLQELLRSEMIAIQQASQDILVATVEGDDARVADLAQKVHDSFILRQSMTPEDKADLLGAVPPEFVTMDRAFHGIAAELAEAARQKDKAKQFETFGKMIEACSSCHAAYATDRFPEFVE